MFPLRFTLLGGSFVFLDVDPSILFLAFLLFLVLWFIFYWQGFIIENQFIPLNPDGPERDPHNQWPNCTQLLHSTGQWIVKQTVLQSRGFSRLPLECGGNLKRYRNEKANSQALPASGALQKSMYNRCLTSLRHSRSGMLVCLDLPWLGIYLQQVRPGAKQTRWTQPFSPSSLFLSTRSIYQLSFLWKNLLLPLPRHVSSKLTCWID